LKRVSEQYGLDREQGTLDFVDVDVEGDTRLFVDPRALRLIPTPWGHLCVSLVQDFFRTVLRSIRDEEMDRAWNLLAGLREPNETHLGLSKGRARGSGLGPGLAAQMRDALAETDAAISGNLQDLEETALLVPMIDRDRISDITINLIREPLIEYTQLACRHYEIHMEGEIDSGPLWDTATSTWSSRYEELPVTLAGKLLLVPKAIVRRELDYRGAEYRDHYLLTYVQQAELAAGSELVRTLKSGERRPPHKKTLKALYGSDKPSIAALTRQYPQALDNYRAAKEARISPPLTHEDFFIEGVGDEPNFADLLGAVRAIEAGQAGATAYERAIEDLLTALFYPGLAQPIYQHRQHNGRKRVDITFANVAERGFFGWLAQHKTSMQVFVECKNYSEDPDNPALDQLSGRFGVNRGEVGFLVCRTVSDKGKVAASCKDTATDGRGFMLVLDDEDLATLVDQRATTGRLTLLKERFDALIS
jgi:hypothetical protein